MWKKCGTPFSYWGYGGIFILKRKNLTLKDNFLTLNCHVCIELNAHSLVLCLLYLKKTNMEYLLLSHLFGSQQCEALFRQVRSFTSTYSTVANCSVKEILTRIIQIQLQSEIAYCSEFFKYPRLGNSHDFSQKLKCELPTPEDIYKQIEACKSNATMLALQLGLLTKAEVFEETIYDCQINPLVSTDSIRSIRVVHYFVKWNFFFFSQLHSTLLKNYADRFEIKSIDEASPYTEIFRGKGKRLVVKKTSLCWLMRRDWQKISADRLRRVQASVHGKPKRILHFDLHKTNKKYVWLKFQNENKLKFIRNALFLFNSEMHTNNLLLFIWCFDDISHFIY